MQANECPRAQARSLQAVVEVLLSPETHSPRQGATIEGMVRQDALLAEIVRRLVEAYCPERVYLFGSKARGEAGPGSDYDLMVVVPDNAPAERRRSRLAYEVLRGTGTAADVLVCTHSYFELRRFLKASLPFTVLREGRLLHGA